MVDFLTHKIESDASYRRAQAQAEAHRRVALAGDSVGHSCPNCPWTYDIARDEFRPVTQADVLRWEAAMLAYTQVLSGIAEMNGKVAALHLKAREAFEAANKGSAA